MTQTTPSTSAQGPERPKPMDLPCMLRDAFLAGRGLKDGDKLSDADQAAWVAYDPERMNAYKRIFAYLTASPSPAAPSGVREDVVAKIEKVAADFDAYAKAYDEQGLKDLALIATAKAFGVSCAVEMIRASLASDASPAPTSGSEDGSEPACWTSEVSLKMAAQGLPAVIHAYPPPVEPVALYRQPLAKPASEPAGGDVREALRWVEQNLAAAKRVMKTSAEHGDGRSNFAAHDAHKHLSTIATALSSSAGPAEPVAWAVDIPGFGLAFFRDRGDAEEQCRAPDCEGSVMRALVYAHPAPATVEISEAMIDAGCAAWVKLYPAFDGEKPQPTAGDVVKAILSAALAPATEGRKS